MSYLLKDNINLHKKLKIGEEKCRASDDKYQTLLSQVK